MFDLCVSGWVQGCCIVFLQYYFRSSNFCLLLCTKEEGKDDNLYRACVRGVCL